MIFEKLSKLSDISVNVAERLIIYGDGSGHIENSHDDDMGSWADEAECEALLDRLIAKWSKPFVVGQKVQVKVTSNWEPGEIGVVKSVIYGAHSLSVEFEPTEDVNRVHAYSYPFEDVRAVSVARKVGDLITILDQYGIVHHGDGIIVKIDDSGVPYGVFLFGEEDFFWASEDELS